LDPVDQTWVNTMHPLGEPNAPAKKPAAAPASSEAAAPSKAVFDQLMFGDTRAQVLAKLKASKIVELTVTEAFLGRTGLNGVFRTRKKIGGLDASLYFDWTGDDKLKEVTLQTETVPLADYQAKIAPSWKEFVSLLTTLYGQPAQKGTLPNPSSLGDGSFTPSHLWLLESGGSALLGTARDGNKFQLVVRFTQRNVATVSVPSF
jgi:hypothetical protein